MQDKDKKRSNFKRRGSKSQKGKGKEMEFNIPDKDINSADLPRGKAKNDISWYSHYKRLLEGVTGVNYAQPLGSDLGINPVQNWHNASGDDVAANISLIQHCAGICSIGFVPTLGTANAQVESTANKVAVQLYSAMRMKLGSVASYEPCDIMMYLGAMDSALMLYALGVKIYGVMRMASPQNLYMINGLAEATGADYMSFNQNLNDFRAYINRFAIYLSSLEVPASFDIFKRHVWMIQNLFTDSNTAKAQIYTYRLDGYYTYVEKTEGPSYLSFTAAPSEWNYQNYIAACQSVLSPLLGSSDITQMSADIGKAFEHDVYVMSTIPDDYVTPISYSQEVLSQFENATLCGVPSNSTATLPTGYKGWDIYQDNSLTLTNPQIIQKPWMSPLVGPATAFNFVVTDQVKANYMEMMARSKVLNFHKSDITSGDTIVATRGMISSFDYGFGADNAALVYAPVYYGTEIYTYATIYTIGSAGPFGDMNKSNYSYAMIYNSAGNDIDRNAIFKMLADWSQFDWAPVCMFALNGHTAHRFLDVDQYAVVNPRQLMDMHMCAVLSEFWSDKFPQLHE